MPAFSWRQARWSIGLLGFTLFSFASDRAAALDVVLVEEHWELHVGGPDVGRSAPQLTMLMSPTASTDSDFFLVNLNHWTIPDYEPGGIQVHRWLGDNVKAAAHSSNYAPLAADAEIISWVQRMSIAGGQLKFEVVNGNSQSWGSFGGNGQLKLTHATALTRLNDYHPSVSLSHSGVGYAGNRVSVFVLKRLRWITSDDEMHEMIAPIDISVDLDP